MKGLFGTETSLRTASEYCATSRPFHVQYLLIRRNMRVLFIDGYEQVFEVATAALAIESCMSLRVFGCSIGLRSQLLWAMLSRQCS